MKAKLVLENGAVFHGTMFGSKKNIAGEVIFTTGMVGYQDTLSDLSHSGQIVVMTFPLVGNYGINKFDIKVNDKALNALVVREKCDYPSNFRSEETLDGFLNAREITGLEGVDTRAITKMIRDNGTMKGVIVTEDTTDEEIKALIDNFDINKVGIEKTAEKPYVINPEAETNIAFIDMGAKNSALSDLQDKNLRITVYPKSALAEEILAIDPKVVVVSNGPGNPENEALTIDCVKELSKKAPVFGVGLGYQVLALALGAKIEKLTFGHHGSNYPVKDTQSGRVYITAQNHNFSVASLAEDMTEEFINVNDKTIEGFSHKTLPAAGVQFYPQGELDMKFLLNKLLKEVL